MKKTFSKNLIFLGSLLFMSLAYGQTLTGTVSVEYGPLPGANVLVKGTMNGTLTDFDGNYTLSNVASDATISISYIGYKTLEIAVNGQASINISLEEDASQLSEVIVTGYSAQTRGDITGSVSSVDVSEAFKNQVVNAGEALDGRVTGVQVQTSGQPGQAPNIVIRGFGSTNSTGPLFIIDGVQTDDPNILNSINPADIKQMNVLKDGAAAIYGARASNGVVIVTTRGGGYNMDKAKISVGMYTGFADAVNRPDLLNVEQHAQMIWDSQLNSGVPNPTHPQYGSGASPTIPSTIQFTPDGVTANVTPGGTNWFDEIFKTALANNYSLSMQNGGESGKYFMSVNYLNREGIQAFTGFERLATRLNSEFKIGKYVTIGEHLNVSFSDQNSSNETEMAFRMSPLVPVRDTDGNFAGTYSGATGLGNPRNPVAELSRAKDDYTKTFRAFGDVYMEVKPLEGLTIKTNLSGSMSYFDQRRFFPLQPEHSESRPNNELQVVDGNAFLWNWSNTVNYVKAFGDHNINILVGIEALQENRIEKDVRRRDFLFETPSFYQLGTGTATPFINNSLQEGFSMNSYFGSANYSYKNRYLATATLRRDKSSRFLGDNQVGVFPSFSAGWRVSQEDFFPQDGIINNLKLKASWGKLGNQTLPAENPTLNIVAVSEGGAFYAFNGNNPPTSGAELIAVGNPDLKWETSVAQNYGVDLAMLDNKLSIGFEYFNITTEDLISRDNNLISTTAIDALPPLVNRGSVQNTGFDLSIGYNDQTESGFSYGINANISHYRNEVTDLNSAFQTGYDTGRIGTVTRTQVGQPISSFFGLLIDGFDDTGRWTYVDVDGDGIAGNDGDRTIIGSPHPDFTFGVNLNAAYKGIDISALFTGSQGNDIFNYTKYYTDFPSFFNGNRSAAVLDSWTPTNTNATLPALSTNTQNVEADPSSYYVEDGSFARLKNLQIGYTLPNSITNKISESTSFRVYVQGTNLITWTKYTGLDPEIIGRQDDNATRSLGIDNQVYPLARLITLGINANF
jgi:TonB-linked SusC/RagA family outer membrane protein